MPLLDDGPLQGLYFPDYPDGTSVNLLAGLVRARGGVSPHADLPGLPYDGLGAAPHAVCVTVDGLGKRQLDDHLERHPGSPFLGRHPHRVLSTVFPATTASAVTTLLTGTTPAEHAILGWHLNLPDLGLASVVLLSQARTGVPGLPDGFDLAGYLALPSYLDSVPGPRAQIAYGEIPFSRFSRAMGRWEHVDTFATLPALVERTLRFVDGVERGLACVYWPRYDGLCHELGVTHPRSREHLREVDEALAALAGELARRGTALLVTADHGIRDTPEAQRIDLSRIPGFYDCLATLPCGDVAHVACYVRPRREARFLDLVAEHLGDACHCVAGETLLELGAFGGGTPHPALAGRVADHFLIARDREAFAAPPAGTPARFMIGNHGGMSEVEMRVPLYCVVP